MTNLFENPRARRSQISFEVKINDTGMLQRIATWEANEQLRVVGRASNVDTVDADLMLKYIKNLLSMRVSLANNETVEREKRILISKLYVPARLYVMLDHIGEAHDYGRNIKFYPNYEANANDYLSAEQMANISEIMSNLKMDGYTVVRGIPTHTDGSVEFMAKVALAEGKALDTIRGMDVHNPVFGFFAHVFSLEVLNLTYKELEFIYRVEYSAGDIYQLQFNDYFRSVNSDAKQGTVPTTGDANQ